MANQLGKRFQCEKCGTEILCIKPGDGEIECCSAAMTLMQPKSCPRPTGARRSGQRPSIMGAVVCFCHD
jgi:hypothetical protein